MEAAQAEDGKQKPQPPAHLTEGGRKPQPRTEWRDGERSPLPPPPAVRPHSGDKIASKHSGRSGGWRGTATWVFGFGLGLIRTQVGPGPN